MISKARCVRPLESVLPMYMPGRLRTASKPSRCWRSFAVYEPREGPCEAAAVVTRLLSIMAVRGALHHPTGHVRQAVRHDACVHDLVALPKAHLHLHLTGGMRPATLVELAAEQGRKLPSGLLDPSTVDLDATSLRGWHKFQRLYDAARAVLVGPAEVTRVVQQIVADQAAA